METSAAFSPGRSKSYEAILSGGLIAGVLDLSAAIVQGLNRGGNPVRLLQTIASGLLGADAYRGGAVAAVLGFICHFIIAIGAAATFYAASRKWKFLVDQAVISGLWFGIAVWLFMNFIVLPLSAFPHKPSYSFGVVATGLVIHMLCVGLPISLAVRRSTRLG